MKNLFKFLCIGFGIIVALILSHEVGKLTIGMFSNYHKALEAGIFTTIGILVVALFFTAFLLIMSLVDTYEEKETL